MAEGNNIYNMDRGLIDGYCYGMRKMIKTKMIKIHIHRRKGIYNVR